MAGRISMGLLGAGAALTVLLPILGIPTMVIAAVGLAIVLEEDFVTDESLEEARRGRAPK
jgi:hypothetical protein